MVTVVLVVGGDLEVVVVVLVVKVVVLAVVVLVVVVGVVVGAELVYAIYCSTIFI